MDKRHFISLFVGIVALVLNWYFFFDTPWFAPMFIVALSLAWSTYWIDFFIKTQRERELESRFPDFVRNLVGAVRSGMPMAKAIIYVSGSDYGALNPYVKKLANQVEWSIPVHEALHSFAANCESRVIKRAISTVTEAEESGGNIEDVLESVTSSLIEIRKLKETRRASIHGQVVQSYVIFFVFLITMIIVQNFLIPYMSRVQSTPITSLTGANEIEFQASPLSGDVLSQRIPIDYSTFEAFITSFIDWLQSFHGIFLMLSLIQALFAGLVTGKLSEGDIRSGIKHSLILMTAAFFIVSLSQGF